MADMHVMQQSVKLWLDWCDPVLENIYTSMHTHTDTHKYTVCVDMKHCELEQCGETADRRWWCWVMSNTVDSRGLGLVWKKRKISPYRKAGVESLTSSVWSWCRVHVWPEWKVDIMLLLHWEWKHVELKIECHPQYMLKPAQSCCIVQVVVVEVVNSHKQLKDILNLIVNKSNHTVRCSDDVGVLFVLWPFIPWHQSVKPVIIIIIIIIVVSCISRASMTQWKRTTACKSFTSLDKTTPRFVQNCFVRDAFCLPLDTWQVLPCSHCFHRSFSNYSLPASAGLRPAVGRLARPPQQPPSGKCCQTGPKFSSDSRIKTDVAWRATVPSQKKSWRKKL